MDFVIIIFSVIAAIVGVVSAVVAIRNSKRYILRRIEKLEQKVRKIDWDQDRKYGHQRMHIIITPPDRRRQKYLDEIERLKRLL